MDNELKVNLEELSWCISALKYFDGHITFVRKMGDPLVIKTPTDFDDGVEIAIKILEKLEKYLKG